MKTTPDTGSMHTGLERWYQHLKMVFKTRKDYLVILTKLRFENQNLTKSKKQAL